MHLNRTLQFYNDFRILQIVFLLSIIKRLNDIGILYNSWNYTITGCTIIMTWHAKVLIRADTYYYAKAYIPRIRISYTRRNLIFII